MSRAMNIGTTRMTSPVWTNDFLSRDHLIPGGAKLDAAQFYADDAVVVTVGAAGALAAATSVPVDALSGPIPSGTIIHLGTNKFIKLSADAAAGATSLATVAIPTALVDNDTGIYPGVNTPAVPSGTVVGRTIAERDASDGFGPADAADDEIYIIAFDVDDPSVIPDITLVRHNAVIKENFLPGWATLASGVQDAVRLAYRCIRGAE